MIEKIHKYIVKQQLLRPGDRLGVAVSGGADSVALLRVLVEQRQGLGIVLSVAHFHHQIRGAEADADEQFVKDLAKKLALEMHSGSADVPAHAREQKISLETAARELRHQWFAELIGQGKVDKIATAHTQDDQAETVLMRLLRGAGTRGLAGIAPEQKEKHLVRPFLEISRREIEAYLAALDQPWREDSTNRDPAHTRNRIRHELFPLLEREFNPAIRDTLADLAEIARAEEDYWSAEVHSLLPRLARPGKPSRSGRTTSGEAADVVALDLVALRHLPLAVQRQVLHKTAEQFGAALDFKHIQQLTELVYKTKPGKCEQLPGELLVTCTLRELQFSRKLKKEKQDSAVDYQYSLSIPGEIAVPELGQIIRVTVISAGKQGSSAYNETSLLARALLAPQLTIRNWRSGDRFFPAHTHSPKKVKELLQSGRLAHKFTSAERKNWPVAESEGKIVWMRGFPVPQAYAAVQGEAVLIEELNMSSGAK